MAYEIDYTKWSRNAGAFSPYDPTNQRATNPFVPGMYADAVKQPIPFEFGTSRLFQLGNGDFLGIDLDGTDTDASYPFNVISYGERSYAGSPVNPTGATQIGGNALARVFNLLFGWLTV